MKRCLFCGLALVLLFLGGCKHPGAGTLGWVRVETEDLIIRTDVQPDLAVELAQKWQRLRNAIADNELPCAFERSNVPMEFVLFRDEQDLQDLYRRFVAGLTVRSPSSLLDSNTQYVIVRKEATNNTQLFAHELTHAAVTICFPGARPWLHEGMASFYETAQVRDGKLVLGMPAYGFVAMTNVEPTRDIYSVYVNGTTVLMLPPRLVPDFDELRTMDPVAFAFLGRSRSPSELRLTTAHYAGSWHAVHLLQFGDRTLHPRFRTYLTRLAEGEDDDRAWDSAFYGVDVAARYRDYLNADYKMMSRPIELAAPREPSVHPMTQEQVALLRARLYGWSTDADMAEARKYLDFAAERAPSSVDVMLHLAAFHSDTGNSEDGEHWLRRALEMAPNDPEVLATAIRWYAPSEEREARRADLDEWGGRLAESAQTAFHHAELGEYLLLIAEDPEAAFEQLNKSLTLDATSWRTYALAGRALEELGRAGPAMRAYQTAIALSEDAPNDFRDMLRLKVKQLRAQRGAPDR